MGKPNEPSSGTQGRKLTDDSIVTTKSESRRAFFSRITGGLTAAAMMTVTASPARAYDAPPANDSDRNRIGDYTKDYSDNVVADSKTPRDNDYQSNFGGRLNEYFQHDGKAITRDRD